MKIKTFCFTKGPAKTMKRQAIYQEKIFENHISDKDSYLGYIKPLKLNSKNANSPIRKWAKDMKRNFTKEDIWMSNEHKKRCSTSIAIRKMPK